MTPPISKEWRAPLNIDPTLREWLESIPVTDPLEDFRRELAKTTTQDP